MTSRMVQIAAGEELVPALGGLDAGAWVQGNGHVEGVELRLPGEATDVVRAIRGRLVLVSLQGAVGGVFTVTLARATEVGLELIGGVLQRARSQGVTLAVQSAATAAAAPPAREPAARREVITPAPAPAPAALSAMEAASAPSAPPAKSWADVAAASDDAESDDDDDRQPERGDLVDHFSFGLCEVVKSDGDRLHLRDVKGPGRIREVVTSALKVMPPTQRDGKRCFRLQRRT